MRRRVELEELQPQPQVEVKSELHALFVLSQGKRQKNHTSRWAPGQVWGVMEKGKISSGIVSISSCCYLITSLSPIAAEPHRKQENIRDVRLMSFFHGGPISCHKMQKKIMHKELKILLL